jgi:hypothetical protein
MLTDEVAAAIAGSPHLAGLQRLDLARCKIRRPGAAALAESRVLSGNLRLNLRHNLIDRKGAELLRQRFGTHVLTE